MSYFIAEVDRYQIPDRAAAALATGLLRDIGKITETVTSLVVDKNKIRRARKIRQEKQIVMRFNDTYGAINCLGFDGKKDKNTKVLVDSNVDGKITTKQDSITEEHSVFVNEPEGKYLDHISVEPGKGTGRDLANDVCDLIREYNSQESIEAICADGTSVNTGYKTGAIAETERNFEKTLQWLICLKHYNELPY